MPEKRSWRERLLRRGERVPLLNDGFVPSFRVYIRGNGQHPAFTSLVGDLANLQSPRGYRPVTPLDIEANLEEGLLMRHNVRLSDLLWGRITDEVDLRSQLFDTIETIDEMLQDVSPEALHRDFVDFVTAILDRENQPYQLRDGQIVDRHSQEQWEVVEGLEELAPDDELRKILHAAVADFLNPREDRKQPGILQMALAFDGAKRRLATDGREAFRLVTDDALNLPAVAEAEKAGAAWTHLFTDLNEITHQMVRHGAPDRPTPKTDATTEFLFFSLSAAVRLLLMTLVGLTDREVRRARRAQGCC